MGRARWGALLLLLACTDPEPRTQVMVFVRGEAEVIARTERLEVEVYGAEAAGGQILQETLIYTDSSSPDFLSLEWPRRIALVPANDDPTRRFAVVARALESGTEFARTEVTSSYLPGQTLTLDVWLRDDCIGRTCASGTTCVAGECTEVTPTNPCDLRVLETEEVPEGCDPSDAGVDDVDGAVDAGTDGGLGEDGGTDGGSDGGLDGGPDPLDEYNVVFVASEPIVPGGLGGIEAAHTHCQDLAEAEGLPEPASYRAFLSTSTEPATALLSSSRGFVRVDGLPFADLPGDLADGKIFYPVALTEKGLPATLPVVTGTTVNLTAGTTCTDWTDASSSTVEAGNAFDGPPFWANRRFGFGTPDPAVRCDETVSIYCFGTGRIAELEPPDPPSGSGGVFLSANAVDAGGGTAAFDAACQAEGGESYVAFLPAMAEEAANARLGDFGGPWVRPDGVVVAENVADLSSEELLAAINVTAAETYVAGTDGFGGVWSNAVAPNAVQTNPALSCTAWADAGQRGRVSYHGRTERFYSVAYDRNCTPAEGGERVYCISTEPVY